MSSTPGVSVALLRPLAELLRQVDVEPRAFLDELGVDDAMAPNVYVPASKLDDALERVAARRGDPAFALTLARLSLARPLGLFGHVVWLSGSVRDALTRAVKFWGVVSQRSTLLLDESRGAIAMVRQRGIGDAPRGRIVTELPFASLALRARAATGDAFALREVRFAHAGEATPAYTELFRAPVVFGAAADELDMDASQLDLPLASADPITSEALEAKAAQLMTAAPVRDPWLERVRAALTAADVNREDDDDDDDAAVTLATLAKRLGTSERTLRRQLEKHGTSLRAIVDELRRERADELLAKGTPVKEVAFALGFSEPSAFSRAYKRWTGKPPKAAGPR